MDLLEYQGKQLFGKHGLLVSDGKAVTTVEEAMEVAESVGYPVMVKSQVLIGGRGKAGGVKFCPDAESARENATNILGLNIGGHITRTIWVEHASDIEEEYYASILLDRSESLPMLIFSTEGGMDIEEVAEKTPEKLIKHHIDPLVGLEKSDAVRVATEAGVTADVIDGVADALVKAYEVWIEEDATLVEINPLIIQPDRSVKALDAKVSLDDSAEFRHPEHAGFGDAANADPIELRAKEQDVIYVKLDGDIGILGNGAGLVMSTLDVVAQHGGKPANFLDAGGGSDAAKVKLAVELILRNENVNAVLFNIFGGITRCDEVANGLISAFEELKPEVPFVVRLDGTNDVQGREILEAAALPNVYAAKTMDEAAAKVVALAGSSSTKEQ